jgi:hypothetical protein
VITYIRDVSLKELFRNTGFVDETGGDIDRRIRLAGRGTALHDVLSTADGEIDVVMHGRPVSVLLVEAIGLDVAETLGLYLGEDTAVPIRCLIADLAVEAGWSVPIPCFSTRLTPCSREAASSISAPPRTPRASN